MIQGFFTKKETESVSRPDGKVRSCSACGLYKDCNSPRMKPYGNFKKKILVVGEAPGEVEDRAGKPWQGKTGRLLQNMCKQLGIDLFEDCLNTNAVTCRPMDKQGNNRSPSTFEVDCCRKSVIQTIKKYEPKIVLLLGNIALLSVIGNRWKKDLGGITKWRGFKIPDQDFNAWLCPTFHPSFIDRLNVMDDTVEEVIWKQDLQNAFSLQKTPVIKQDTPEIEIIEDLSIFKKLKISKFAFDYETTGLKPHATGHRIICASLSFNKNHSYAFMMPTIRKERQPFIDLLTDPKIGKIAQNFKYEHTWSQVRLNVEVQNWIWDTMLASHLFDNRPGITSLKFQTYINFGIVDYASEIAPYLQATDNKNGNALNKITDLLKIPGGKEKLLRYCGLDSIYEYMLAEIQEVNMLPF